MVQSLPARLPETPSQTAGPYVHIGLIPHQAGFAIFERSFSNVLVGADAQGERIVVEGRVFDGANEPVRDALIEVWQADAAGRYAHPADPRHASADPALSGWGRTGSDFETGLYRFETVKPGPVAGRHGRPMAPHLNLWIVARGINIGLQTRLYFADETEANAADPVLNLIEQASRRQTLLARRETRDGTTVYVFDIHLQGDAETVFFDV
jgi:protocatechuate 3,4-dioxygenase alpha subunit